MEQVSKFVQLVVAVLKGDDAEATALKIQRKGSSILKAQIAIKQAEMLNLEEVLEQAQDTQAQARINKGELISNNNSYVRGLIDADNAVTDAKNAITDLSDEIDFLSVELELISK